MNYCESNYRAVNAPQSEISVRAFVCSLPIVRRVITTCEKYLCPNTDTQHKAMHDRDIKYFNARDLNSARNFNLVIAGYAALTAGVLAVCSLHNGKIVEGTVEAGLAVSGCLAPFLNRILTKHEMQKKTA